MSRRTDLDLSDDQRFALMKLRRNVADMQLEEKYDDCFLLRWLGARNFDTKEAEDMLRTSMKWREEWSINKDDGWKPPQLLVDHIPCGICGYDKEGSPVVVIPVAGFDVCGLIKSVSPKDIVRYLAQKVDSYLEVARQSSLKHGPKASQINCIADLTDFNLRQFTWRPAAELVINLLQMYEANYPEILKSCFAINAPKVFAFAFNILKNILTGNTLSKFVIYKADPNKWKPALASFIDGDQYPAFLGGNLRDPDGDPRYTTKIVQGGKVPKEMYKKTDKLSLSEDMTLVNIKKGDKLQLKYTVTIPHSFIRWQFKTECHDIKFGILATDAENIQTVLMPIKKVACHEFEEIGVIKCKYPGEYTVVFDNSYSFIRSKKLAYNVHVTLPVNEKTIDTIDQIVNMEE
ncbi:GOLD domain,CRAL/TRIO, N-terminal domain,CRAL-TRIO lipid binding domain [Cinara cedri]|uniref:GOLD domain,CRAL/TRIO, N-terminal domain,CRAL-TRIO lipid binding domain n=3 Tax=Cinara cedri TaxID=506608 RepID=A0A5E4M954_9HEMI|nr:GOLD domain,CRAL/TRIO, N-terminal domain,CRAL-TRIO lipid binding domain [Cinara cedri]